MSHKQIQSCLERLAEVSPDDADIFARMMRDADALIAEGFELRRTAWSIYHRHIPSKEEQRAAEKARRAIWR